MGYLFDRKWNSFLFPRSIGTHGAFIFYETFLQNDNYALLISGHLPNVTK
ncbi:hypothetical protein C8N25_1082 [Algoriphagus antarcticus]|uniref:Uncharacterized protein n=1 Tax=Algoriphagus antarcticus TaxID=238540 RepID=A0A3E0DYB7_9BACT|nr:hypothetical protein C8N25_1082 [Algoriphagus antarcticus]